MWAVTEDGGRLHIRENSRACDMRTKAGDNPRSRGSRFWMHRERRQGPPAISVAESLCEREASVSFDDTNVNRYYFRMAIVSFRCTDTASLWADRKSRRFGAIAKVAMRKLAMLDAAAVLDDLRIPPANHLEALSGDRKGQHSIRINGRMRICFKWRAKRPEDIEIVDCH